MKPKWNDDELRLLALAEKWAQEEMTASDHDELEEMLASSEDHRMLFSEFSNLNAALEFDPEIHQELEKVGRPDNILSLSDGSDSKPGMKFASDAPSSSKNSDEISQRMGVRAAIGLAALVCATAFSVYLLVGKKEKSGESDLATTASVSAGQTNEVANKAETSTDPETQYRQAIIANLGTGSQTRPPTNFEQVSFSSEDGELSYNRDIRPILSDNCFACHGPDAAGRKAKLRLDQEAGAKGGDDPVILAGAEAAESRFISRILSSDPDEMMPPPGSHKRLTDAQIALLRRWVEEGAAYEAHWAFVEPKNVIPEALPTEEKPIDYLVKNSLLRHQLDFSKEADRYTLIRRASFDLTGLPPTPEEIEQFVSDDSAAAYEKLLDRLLQSPAYGEHRARYWLDAARYGDTHGLHLDNYREIWPYRDWVIRAYSENMPFDQFTIEQLAGDLLREPSQSQRVATGFNRCNVTTSEGGAIEEEFLVRYAVDRVATTSTVWLGLTAGCAQCHDHKFDPLTMREFYQLFAFFNNTTQPGMDGNAKDSPPVIRVYREETDADREKKIRARVSEIKKELSEIEKQEEEAFQKWAQANKARKNIQIDWADAILKSPANSTFGKPTDLGNVDHLSKDQPFSIAFRYKFPPDAGYKALVLLRKQDPENEGRGWEIVAEKQKLMFRLIESWPNRILQTAATQKVRSSGTAQILLTYDGSGQSAGMKVYINGKPMSSRFISESVDTMTGDFASPAPVIVGGDVEVTDFRIYHRALTSEEALSMQKRSAVSGLLAKEKKSDQEWKDLRSLYLQTLSADYQSRIRSLSLAEMELSELMGDNPLTLVMQEKANSEPKAHILIRGEYEQKGEEVSPGFPDFLPDLDRTASGNRLDLAKWLVDKRHPLTARVTVNRVWQELFGVGLVKTSEDFGTQGEAPSHPELLDWLAIRFVDSGWDVKALYKEIMMSRTYRQSSAVSTELVAADPQNRWLARGPRFRLDAEMIRDQALAASGLLDPSVGGPGVKPYQPSGIWKTVGYTNSNTQTFFQDYGKSAEHRRSLYTFWKRTAPPPNMAIFDAPNREDCVVRRERTNTPLQALVLMNDPQFVRASRFLALRAIRDEEATEDRLELLSLLLRGKPVSKEEKVILRNSLDQFRNAYGSDTVAAAEVLQDKVNHTFSIQGKGAEEVELASWMMVASQFLNLDESVTKY